MYLGPSFWMLKNVPHLHVLHLQAFFSDKNKGARASVDGGGPKKRSNVLQMLFIV